MNMTSLLTFNVHRNSQREGIKIQIKIISVCTLILDNNEENWIEDGCIPPDYKKDYWMLSRYDVSSRLKRQTEAFALLTARIIYVKL